MHLGQFWDELATDLVDEFHTYRFRLKDISISVKADTTLLTGADVAIENMIIDRIREIEAHCA